MTAGGRKVWILVDGFPHWLLDHVETRTARFPMLCGMIARGYARELLPNKPNCQTPPSLASLYSGTRPETNGITGFNLPVFKDGDPNHKEPAFPCGVRGSADWIWNHVTQQSNTISLSHIPFVNAKGIGVSLDLGLYGFGQKLIGPAVFDLKIGHTIEICSESTSIPVTLKTLSDTAYIVSTGCETSGHQVVLTCEVGQCIPLTIAPGLQTKIQVDLVDGRLRAFFFGLWQVEMSGSDVHVTDYKCHSKFAFIGATFSKHYRSGRLGKTLQQGGHGEAERRFVRFVRQVAKRYYNDALYCVKYTNSDYVLAYQPAVDLVLHEFTGQLHSDCRHFNIDNYDFLNSLIHEVLDDLETFLTHLSQLLAPEDKLLISSDHGMAPIDTIIHINMLLREGGFLSTDGPEIDFENTDCFYHSAENGLLVFNKNRVSNIALKAEMVHFFLCKEIKARTGRQPELFRYEAITSEDARWETTHYVYPGRNNQFKSDIVDGEAVVPSIKTGDHCVWSSDYNLSGIVLDVSNAFFAAQEKIQTYEIAGAFMAAGGD